jgi:hypothetical protein
VTDAGVVTEEEVALAETAHELFERSIDENLLDRVRPTAHHLFLRRFSLADDERVPVANEAD